MYNTLNPRFAATPAARRIELALLTVCTMAFASQSYGQGYVPLYHHDNYARVFCTVPDGFGGCEGVNPLGLALADVTGKDSESLYPDGWLDVAVANQYHPSAHGSVSVFRNTQEWLPAGGTTGLELVQQILLPNPPQGGASATRVGFGRFADDTTDALELDIAVVARDENNNVSRVYIYMYDGPTLPHYPGTPDYTIVPSSVQRVEGMCVGDFDGDGDSDIAVVGNRTDGQTITPRADVLWKGTSQFTQEEISLPEPSGGWGSNPRATDVVAANVRQPPVSGRLDLAITFRPDNWLVRALNTGSTPTWDAEDGDIARPALSLAAGRFRPGSLIDLVISKGNEFGVPNRCFALHNQGSTEFRYQLDTNTVYRVEPGTDPFGLATGLLNVADSYVDFVAACQHGGPDNWGHGGVMVFRGYNDGTFNTTPHWFFVDDHINRSGVHPKPCFVKVGDMNNDGLQDIVTSNNTSHTISVLLQIPYDDEQ